MADMTSDMASDMASFDNPLSRAYRPAGEVQNKGPWKGNEDQHLLHVIDMKGVGNWVHVSHVLGTRTAKQCRERFHQNLKPGLNHGPITPEEGARIEYLVETLGRRWADIARILEDRSDNAVKNWWNGSMNRRRRMAKAQESGSQKEAGGKAKSPRNRTKSLQAPPAPRLAAPLPSRSLSQQHAPHDTYRASRPMSQQHSGYGAYGAYGAYQASGPMSQQHSGYGTYQASRPMSQPHSGYDRYQRPSGSLCHQYGPYHAEASTAYMQQQYLPDSGQHYGHRGLSPTGSRFPPASHGAHATPSPTGESLMEAPPSLVSDNGSMYDASPAPVRSSLPEPKFELAPLRSRGDMSGRDQYPVETEAKGMWPNAQRGIQLPPIRHATQSHSTNMLPYPPRPSGTAEWAYVSPDTSKTTTAAYVKDKDARMSVCNLLQ